MVLLLGLVTGVALVAPVGPVALTLFGLGAERGRRVALAGAGGVVLADALTVPVALGAAGAVQALDPTLLRAVEVAMGVALAVTGAALVLAADRAREVVSGIQRPARALAAMTLCNPLGVVAWTGVALALPDNVRQPSSLLAFGIGLVLASAVWHAALALASGSLATRLAPHNRVRLTQVSGAVLLVAGVLLVA